jgi:lipoprotein-releasing system ATP-binding protein
VGASGAGKTTLLQILGTLSRPASGKVYIDQKEVSRLDEKGIAQFRNRNIGFVFQFHHLLPEFTALENVCIPAYINRIPKVKAEQKGKELLAFLGLADRMTHKPDELSGGEQQRVSVARALINNPMVIFADEPSGNLDSHNKQELHSLFFSLRDTFGQTFVIVTHDTHLADMSDIKYEMNDGRIVE